MQKELRAEDVLKIVIDDQTIKKGSLLAISSAVFDRTFCFVKDIKDDRMELARHIDKTKRLVTTLTADDIIEYDLRIEVV